MIPFSNTSEHGKLVAGLPKPIPTRRRVLFLETSTVRDYGDSLESFLTLLQTEERNEGVLGLDFMQEGSVEVELDFWEGEEEWKIASQNICESWRAIFTIDW